MKPLFSFSIVIICFTLFLSACGDEPIVQMDPNLTTTTAANDTLKAVANQFASINISGIKGSAELNGIEVFENDVKVSFDRIRFKGTAVAANPILLLTNDRQGFTAEVRLRTLYADIVTKITITLIDNDGNRVSVSRMIKATKQGPVIGYSAVNPVNAVAPGTDYGFRFSVTTGSAPLSTISVKENGVIITDVSRLKFDGIPFFSNPEFLPSNKIDGFVSNVVSVVLPATIGKWQYTFTFTDTLGGFTEYDVVAYVGTKLDFVATGVLLNAAGPQGTGGLDLDMGISTGSDDAEAEIKDEGIDAALPLANNWKQKISAAGSAELRRVIQVIDISDIYVKEQILNYWNLGSPVSGPTPNKVLVNDIFVVKKEDRYYFLQIDKVTVTPTDNTDKFEVSIKW
ncbi:MAG: hypothetical protein KBF57_00205 [Saprospiraceae bacterium]|jgi:hypothetical protein|nr:hypothetical protein [Saprospiraceae bacterium]MBP9193071.1 hypothetical protein [Saprospiraceae bacterium]